MVMFKYIGDPDHDGEGPDTIEAYGCQFVPGEPTDVTEDFAIKKLDGNSHFERVDGRSKEARKAKKKEDAESE